MIDQTAFEQLIGRLHRDSAEGRQASACNRAEAGLLRAGLERALLQLPALERLLDVSARAPALRPAPGEQIPSDIRRRVLDRGLSALAPAELAYLAISPAWIAQLWDDLTVPTPYWERAAARLRGDRPRELAAAPNPSLVEIEHSGGRWWHVAQAVLRPVIGSAPPESAVVPSTSSRFAWSRVRESSSDDSWLRRPTIVECAMLLALIVTIIVGWVAIGSSESPISSNAPAMEAIVGDN